MAYTKLEMELVNKGKDLVKKFENVDGKGHTITIKSSDELLAAVSKEVDSKTWCKLSTTLRCNVKEALAFLLDVTSRSLQREEDVVAGKKEILIDEGHSCVYKVVEEVVGVNGVRLNNHIVRKMVWEKKGEEVILFMTPCDERGVEKVPEPPVSPRGGIARTKSGGRIHRRMSKGKGNAAQNRRDDTFCVIKIQPVSR